MSIIRPYHATILYPSLHNKPAIFQLVRLKNKRIISCAIAQSVSFVRNWSVKLNGMVEAQGSGLISADLG